MTDWQRAGQVADAHRVANLAKAFYDNPAKNHIRDWVIAEIKSAGATTVADLWGGGESALALTEAGLSVISVDDGRGFKELGVSKVRARRALAICAEEGGYRGEWGGLLDILPECDAAWLDFCGQWTAFTGEVLSACRHHRIVAITLMPERSEIAEGRLPLEQWIMAIEGMAEGCSWLRVRSTKRYQRKSGQWALVTLLSWVGSRSRKAAIRASKAKPSDSTAAGYRARNKEMAAIDPVYKARRRAQSLTYQYATKAARNRRYRLDPEYHERVLGYKRAYKARKAAEPEAVARRMERARIAYQRLLNHDPAAIRAMKAARARANLRDPIKGARMRETARRRVSLGFIPCSTCGIEFSALKTNILRRCRACATRHALAVRKAQTRKEAA